MKVYICWDRSSSDILIPIKVLEFDKKETDSLSWITIRNERVKTFLKSLCEVYNYEDIVIDRTITTANDNACVVIKVIDERMLNK